MEKNWREEWTDWTKEQESEGDGSTKKEVLNQKKMILGGSNKAIPEISQELMVQKSTVTEYVRWYQKIG
jgi:hypothetical protein